MDPLLLNVLGPRPLFGFGQKVRLSATEDSLCYRILSFGIKRLKKREVDSGPQPPHVNDL